MTVYHTFEGLVFKKKLIRRTLLIKWCALVIRALKDEF